ncbi:putative membrane protein [Virgibacillus subterraneus]|uniref:Membrane protein n=1 Tax=Virgibacillus subterraneus TaxID=621109 RepID=A0A1H9IGQ1_9BACI|nr:SHOCT domain-containing protein [Virgibacillus subterraneus]SEQ73773.1 putative membrane protein [Virgibacillus subterraneus]
MLLSILTEGYIRFGLSIIVAIILIVILIRFRAKKNPAKSSLDILKERHSKGEITKEEYDEARKQQKNE